MADRTHEEEDELTGVKAATRSGDTRGVPPPAPSYQEGRVESVGERPNDIDRDDRTGEGDRAGVTRREEGRSPDAFVSSEVAERISRPMHDPKTRS